MLLWLPADLVADGYSIGATSRLLAQAALFAVPASLIAALLYWRWSATGALLSGLSLTVAGLLGLNLVGSRVLGHTVTTVEMVAVLIIGSNTLLAALVPYATELSAAAVRGRATGWVSGSTKAGGVVAQTLGLLGLSPAISTIAWPITSLLLIAGALVWRYGMETHGRALEEIEHPTILDAASPASAYPKA